MKASYFTGLPSRSANTLFHAPPRPSMLPPTPAQTPPPAHAPPRNRTPRPGVATPRPPPPDPPHHPLPHPPPPPAHPPRPPRRDQPPRERLRRELHPLVGVEHLRASSPERLLQHLQAERPLQRVRQPPGQHISAVPV